MDPPGRNGRPYGLPSGPAAGFQPSARPSPAVQTPQSNGPSVPFHLMSKADQFADAKRRVIQSCFGKLDPDGQPSELYITHIRVIEDARYPQTPPPPNSPRENKKERYIILAVRNTGRVRMHKARENANGTFSIGKTWNFEDITAIQSFTDFKPRNNEEASYGQWAGKNGFNVVIGKPYYWTTNSTNEKVFFLASLVKVYERYTKGKLPQLTGFAASELEDVLSQSQGGVAAAQPQTTTQSQSPFAPNRIRSPFSQNGPGQVPPSPDPTVNNLQSPGLPPPISARRQGFPGQDGRASPALPTPDSLRPGGLRQASSRDQMYPYGSQTPPGRLTPKSSTSELRQNREGTPDSLKVGGNTRRGGGFFSPSEPPSSRDGPPSNGLGIANNFAGSTRANGDRFQANKSLESVNDPAPLPERRRPPLARPPISESRFGSNDGATPMPKPLQPGVRASDRSAPKESPAIDPPPRSPERLSGGRKMSITERLDQAKADSKSNNLEPKAVEAPKATETPRELAPSPDAQSQTSSNEEARPGLGRMFGNKQKSAREILKSAANAYGAFKPRAGGAGARMFATSDGRTNEPDGITGVVPAPSLIRTKTNESAKTVASEQNSIQQTPTSAVGKKSLPDLKVTSPTSPAVALPTTTTLPAGDTAATQKLSDLQQKAADLQQKSKTDEEEAARRKLRRTPQQLKYLERLGVNASLLESRGLEYEILLDEFWPQDTWHTKPVETLQSEVRRELSKVQTGGWFEHIALHDEERKAAISLIDNAMEECEALEKLLTIYSVELGSLADDIAYIEAQGQGLQVQTANQKHLQSELQDLLDTISIPGQKLDPIFNANVISLEGLESTERAVLTLYKALVLIDPSIRPNRGASDQSSEYTTLSKMRALQEKRNGYLEASSVFLTRFKNYMDIVYGQAAMEIEAHIKNDTTRAPTASSTSLQVNNVNAGHVMLWKYSPLLLFAKSVDQKAWLGLLRSYQDKMRTLYGASLGGTFQSCKKLARGTPGEEQELLFTLNENQADTLLSASARKLTVKRSQTLAGKLRAASGDKARSDSQSGGLYPCEAVAEALQDIAPLLLNEQAFVVDFFHANTTETMDFAEAAQATLPENRKGPPSNRRKPYEPNQEMVQLVSGVMADMFSFLPTELQNLVNWAINIGPLQGVGILHALHKVMTNIEDGFLYKTLYSLATKLANDWNRFVGAQVRAIEETKVKIKKRKGIIYFMRVFPNFTTHVENMLPPANEEVSEARTLVDQGYQQIIKAMFESLRDIAKDSPSSAPHAGANDPEDKEALNYHILLIENMNHYVEDVDERGDAVLAEGKTKATEDLAEHLSLYVDAVLRRPIGKIMDFTESLNHALEALGPHASTGTLASKPSFSPSVYKKLIAAHDARELRRGVEALRKRVEKHFGDADEPEISRNLVVKVLASCEERFAREIEKVQTLPKAIYGEDGAGGLNVGREEVGRWFKGGR